MDGWMDRSVDWLFDGSVDWLVGLTKNDSLLFITDSWKRNHQSWKTLSADVNTWLAPCSPYRSMLSFHVPLVSTIITFFTCSYFHYLICRLVSAQEQMKCESHSSFSSLEVSNSPVFPQGESRVCSNLALQSFPWGECLCIGDNPLAHAYVFSLTPPPLPPPPPQEREATEGERDWGYHKSRGGFPIFQTVTFILLIWTLQFLVFYQGRSGASFLWELESFVIDILFVALLIVRLFMHKV